MPHRVQGATGREGWPGSSLEFYQHLVLEFYLRLWRESAYVFLSGVGGVTGLVGGQIWSGYRTHLTEAT